jgi:ribosomal protein L7/L12
MPAIAVAPEIQNFWAPVSQIVPVFALALVIEARRLSKTWVAERKFERRVVPPALAATAFILYLIESEALTRMLSGEHDRERASWVLLGLLIAATGIGVSPIYNLAVIANADLLQSLVRRLPWSDFRKRERKMEGVLDEYSKIATIQVRQDESMDDLVERAENHLSAQKAALVELDELLAIPAITPDIEDTLTAMRLKATAKIQEAADALADVRKARREIQHTGVNLVRAIDQTEAWAKNLPEQVREADAADVEERLNELKRRYE